MSTSPQSAVFEDDSPVMPAWKQEVNARLVAHRTRRTRNLDDQPALPGLPCLIRTAPHLPGRKPPAPLAWRLALPSVTRKLRHTAKCSPPKLLALLRPPSPRPRSPRPSQMFSGPNSSRPSPRPRRQLHPHPSRSSTEFTPTRYLSRAPRSRGRSYPSPPVTGPPRSSTPSRMPLSPPRCRCPFASSNSRANSSPRARHVPATPKDPCARLSPGAGKVSTSNF